MSGPAVAAIQYIYALCGVCTFFCVFDDCYVGYNAITMAL